MKLYFNRPGRPMINVHTESFNGRPQDECLNAYQFFSIDDARGKVEAWRVDYNLHCPHSSLGQLTPSEYLSRSGLEDEEATIF